VAKSWRRSLAGAPDATIRGSLSLCGFSSLPRQGAYANTRRLDHQQIAGKLAFVDANDLRYQLSFRRTRQAIEFK
jgi:hypothetical protein